MVGALFNLMVGKEEGTLIESTLGDELEKAQHRADEISAEITRIRKEIARSEKP